MLAFKMLQDLGFLDDPTDKFACWSLDQLPHSLEPDSPPPGLAWDTPPGGSPRGAPDFQSLQQFPHHHHHHHQQQHQHPHGQAQVHEQQQQQVPAPQGYPVYHGLQQGQQGQGEQQGGAGGVRGLYGDERRHPSHLLPHHQHAQQKFVRGAGGGGGGVGRQEGAGGMPGMLGGGNGGGVPFPIRPGEPDCAYYLKTGLCAFGMSCKFNHPPATWRQPGNMAMDPQALLGQQFPQRPGQPECQYYMANGTCKFGMTCKFHHPPFPLLPEAMGGSSLGSGAGRGRRGSTAEKGTGGGGGEAVGPMGLMGGASVLNESGYPIRPGEKECAYFMKTGLCKYGATCKFHHPSLRASPTLPTNPYGHASASAAPGHTGGPPQLEGPSPPPAGAASSAIPPLLPADPAAAAAAAAGVAGVPPWPMAGYPMGQPLVPAPLMYQQAQAALQAGGFVAQLAYQQAPGGAAAVLPLPGSSGAGHGLPLRPGVPDCRVYVRTGFCRYGPACRFNHPPLGSTGAEGHENLGTHAQGQAQAQQQAQLQQQQSEPQEPQQSQAQQQRQQQQQGLHPAQPQFQQQQQQQQQQGQQRQHAMLSHSQSQEEQSQVQQSRLEQYLEQQANQPLQPPANPLTLPPMAGLPPVSLSVLGLPLRPGMLPCPQYMQFAECRYGMLCGFDHPLPAAGPGPVPGPGPGLGPGGILLPSPSGQAPLESPSSHRVLLHLPSTLSSAPSFAELNFQQLSVTESPREEAAADEDRRHPGG